MLKFILIREKLPRKVERNFQIPKISIDGHTNYECSDSQKMSRKTWTLKNPAVSRHWKLSHDI